MDCWPSESVTVRFVWLAACINKWIVWLAVRRAVSATVVKAMY